MPATQVTQATYRVTVEAKFLPARLLPHVLGALDLIPREEALQAQVVMATEKYVNYKLPWMEVQVFDRHAVFDLEDESRYEALFDLVVALQDAPGDDDRPAPISDVSGVELLRSAHHKASTRSRAGKRLASLLEVGSLRQELQPIALARLSFLVDPAGTGATRARVTVEPSNKPPAWIYVSSMMAWEINESDKGAEDEHPRLLADVANGWTKAVEMTDSHVEWLLDDLKHLFVSARQTDHGGRVR